MHTRPAAKLFLNDYDILAADGQELRHQDYFFTLDTTLPRPPIKRDGGRIQ